MNEKELEEYQRKLMKGAKGTIGLGIMTGVGSGIVGSMGAAIPGSAPVSGAVNGALGLAAVGNMAAIGMSIMPGTGSAKTTTPKARPKAKAHTKAMDDPASFFR